MLTMQELEVLVRLVVRGHQAETEQDRPTKEDLERAVEVRDLNRRDFEAIRDVMAQVFLSIARTFLPKEERAGQDLEGIKEWIEESVNNGVLEEEVLPVFKRMEEAPDYVHVMRLEKLVTEVMELAAASKGNDPAADLAYQYCLNRIGNVIDEARGKEEA